MRTLRWGILGTGNIARQFANGISGSQRGQLEAVGSRTIDSARAFAGANRISRSYGSYEEVLRHAQVDAIYVSLPNSMHHEWTLQALNAGKHVLCEKPMASNANQARQMFAAAEQNRRMLTEAFMYRSHPLTHAVCNSIAAGEIGELRLIRTSFCYRTTRIADNIRFDPKLAGGGLMDVGCYCINFSRLFAAQEPVEMHIAGHVHERGVDDMAAGTLSFPSGVIASFTCGMSLQADNAAYLCGSEGYIEVPVPWKPASQGAIYSIVRAAPPRMDGPPKRDLPPREARTIDAGKDLYALEADDFAASVLDGVPPRVTRSETLGNMHILDELRNRLGMRVTE